MESGTNVGCWHWRWWLYLLRHDAGPRGYVQTGMTSLLLVWASCTNSWCLRLTIFKMRSYRACLRCRELDKCLFSRAKFFIWNDYKCRRHHTDSAGGLCVPFTYSHSYFLYNCSMYPDQGAAVGALCVCCYLLLPCADSHCPHCNQDTDASVTTKLSLLLPLIIPSPLPTVDSSPGNR